VSAGRDRLSITVADLKWMARRQAQARRGMVQHVDVVFQNTSRQRIRRILCQAVHRTDRSTRSATVQERRTVTAQRGGGERRWRSITSSRVYGSHLRIKEVVHVIRTDGGNDWVTSTVHQQLLMDKGPLKLPRS